ncbi:protoporphyrinogen oxidase [bacterium BMS3Abin08]|nr:protoporphyrinogen oxidase [bacterium BMS3Abin08]
MSVTIVGGGISGLSLAYFLLEKNPSLDLKILEAKDRPGGKIWSDRAGGFLCESGVNGFLDNKPMTLGLASKLSLSPLRSNDNAGNRFVYSNGKLKMIPGSPLSFLFSDLLSFCGKTRIFYEIVAPKGTNDESLAVFATRRLGREAYEKLIDPMASGIYAGDPEKLSLKSCFPRIYELEKKYGSLIRALIRLQKEAKKTGKKVGPEPGGTLTSFYDGMETIIDALKGYLGDRLITERRITGIEKKGEIYSVYTDNGESHESGRVVLACPAYASADITAGFDKDLSGLLKEIPYPAVSVVCLGFRREDVRNNLNGFGFLVPYREHRRILGTLWDSSIFPNRAPEGSVLLRSMIGGVRASDLAMQDNERLVEIVLEELREIMGIDEDPEFYRVYRHGRAIPQYNVGHGDLLQRIQDRISGYPGLYITGNAYRGISVNDCIENSHKLSGTIFAENE